MIEENAKKVKEMDESVLKSLFSDWDETHQLDPFDIVLYGRYGKVSAIIRRIDGECGVLKPLTQYCRISTREKIKGCNDEILNYLDPDGGPMIAPGIYVYDDNTHVLIYEIYAKSNTFVIFYEVFRDDQQVDSSTLEIMHEKLRKITQDMKND